MFEELWGKVKKLGSKDDELEITFEKYREEEKEPVEEEKKIPTPIVANTEDADSAIELKVVHPVSFDEVSTIADYLLDGCTVVLNFELMEPAQAMRMLDFLNGVTYSNDGDIKNVATSTYIITPHNVDISDEK